eukprot:gene6516-8956_t
MSDVPSFQAIEIETTKSNTNDNNNGSCDSDKLPKIPPNGGYGWVVVIASFFVHVFVLGNIYSFGVFFSAYIKDFDSPQGTLSWIGSIGSGLMAGLAAYSGSLADRIGNDRVVFMGGCIIGIGYLLASFSTEVWQLFITQGFIAGIGYSFSFVAGVSVVGQWFSTKRGLAVGIAVAGSGLGQFALAIITGNLILNYGWRSTLRYLSIINFCGLSICAFFIRRFLPLRTQTERGNYMQYFHNKLFLLVYGATFIASLGTMMPYTFLPEFAISHGITTVKAYYLLSIMGICSAIGRVTLGAAADAFGKLVIFKVCILCGGAIILLWMICVTYSSLIAFAAIFGFFAGGIISLIPTVCASLFGLENLGTVLGLVYSATAVGNILSAPIGGFLYDKYHRYQPSIAVVGSFVMLGGLISLFIYEPNHTSLNTEPVDTNDKSDNQTLELGLSKDEKDNQDNHNNHVNIDSNEKDVLDQNESNKNDSVHRNDHDYDAIPRTDDEHKDNSDVLVDLLEVPYAV